MKRYRLILAAVAALCLAACGGEEQPSASSLSAPDNVQLTSMTEDSASFEWDAVSGAETYTWKMSGASGDPLSGTVKTTQVTVNNLVAGTTYSFVVCAGAGKSVSSWSAAVKVTIEKPETPSPASYYPEFKMPSAEDGDVARAFPGAEGGGMYTTGGRGGKVLHVTTLEDNVSKPSEGMFRWAVETQTGARIVVFDVAGRIDLKGKLAIANGNLTIAGQTAPGDGICISGYPINIKASNIIVRFLRFRLGDEYATDDSFDTIWGRYCDDIMIDHCSMSWSIDECCSFYANSNFTLQWCLVAESLNNSGKHSKKNHGYAGIWGGKNASYHHNLLAHHNNRTPRFDHPEIYDATSLANRRGNVDYRNNVNFNWGSGNGCYGGNDGYINIVGNYYKPGPASYDRHYFIEADGHYNAGDSKNPDWHTYQYPYLYLNGNIHTAHEDITKDNSKGVYWPDAKNASNGDVISNSGHILASALLIAGKDNAKAYTTTHDAATAFERVIGYSGCSKVRDVVDKRISNETKTGNVTYKDGGNGSTGGIIDSQTAVGGWPEYNATEDEIALCLDTDKDGMPDWFEDRFGLNKSNASDASAKDIDKFGRYSNLEMYLHYLVRNIVETQNSGGVYTGL